MKDPIAEEEFWCALYLFWDDDRVDQWKEAISGKGGLKACTNLMCMAPHVRE